MVEMSEGQRQWYYVPTWIIKIPPQPQEDNLKGRELPANESIRFMKEGMLQKVALPFLHLLHSFSGEGFYAELLSLSLTKKWLGKIGGQGHARSCGKLDPRPLKPAV
jgi:hypothetical protein